MAAEPIAHDHFDLDVGRLALDFANTLESRYDDPPRDLLTGYESLVGFALAAGTLDADAAQALVAVAAERRADADAVLAAGIELREAVFRIFAAVAAGDSVPDGALADLNGWLARALPHGGVVPLGAGEGFGWAWEPTDSDLTRPLWPIAYDAMDLLLHGPIDRVRECAADDCGWLFIDTTRNRARRWCSMKSCGNRAKVQQFRERARGSQRS